MCVCLIVWDKQFLVVTFASGDGCFRQRERPAEL